VACWAHTRQKFFEARDTDARADQMLALIFVGSDAGGRRAAILYSLVRTCERHNINAWGYLRDAPIRVSTPPAKSTTSPTAGPAP